MDLPSIVIATGDAMLQQWLAAALRDERYRLQSVASEGALFESIDPSTADLVLLDAQLSVAPGAICQRLRWRLTMPILLLHHGPGHAQRVPDLPAGASATLSLPCEAAVLRAHVAALLATDRTRSPAAPGLFQLGAVTIDFGARRALRGGRAMRLSRTEWSILEVLLAQPGEVLTVRALLGSVWGDAYQAERSYAHVYIGRLRRKLEDDPAAPRLLLTEPGVGYRLVVPAAPTSAPPPLPPGPPPEWTPPPLPLPPLPFVGRERELAAVVALVTHGERPLITLTGPGGTGKTALSLHVAAHCRAHFTDGVVLVDTVALSEGALVLRTIAQRLGIDVPPDQSLVAALGGALRALRLLLVLDTFEQVPDGAAAIAALLDATPTARILITSRSALGLPREAVYEVQPLRTPPLDPPPPPAELAHYPAVAMFLERAREVVPELTLTAANAPSIAELCARLDGLPLALELAAARLRWFTPAALVQRLAQQPLTVLTGSHPTRPARHVTLRAMLEWSVQLLSTEQQTLFARLAVFVPGGSVDAAETVCATAGGVRVAVLDPLDALLALHLIQREVDHRGEPRWRMHATIREYAAERLAASGEAPIVQQQHAAYYAALAASNAPTLAQRTPAEWIAQLEREHDNLRAALAWALARDDAALALQLGGGLWRFWLHQGYLHDGQAALAAVLASGAGSPMERWPVVYGLATLRLAQGDQRRAVELYAESRALSGAIGDHAGLAWAQLGLGWAQLPQDHLQAAALFEQSLALCRQHADRRGIAWSLIGIGAAALRQAQHQRAFESCTEGLALCRVAGDPEEIGLALIVLGDVCLAQGLTDRARDHYREGLAQSRARRAPRGIAWATCGLGWAALTQGRSAEADAAFGESLAVALRIGDQRVAHLARAGLGWAALIRGEYAAAEAMWQANEAAADATDDLEVRLWHVLGRGYHALFLGDGARATEYCSEAFTLAGDQRHLQGTLLARSGLAWLALLGGDDAAARTMWTTNLSISRQHGDLWGCAQAQLGLCAAALAAGDSETARAHCRALIIQGQQLDDPGLSLSALEGLAALAALGGDGICAARWYGAAIAQRRALHRPLPPAFGPSQAAIIDHARQATPPELWQAAWEAGGSAPLDTVLAEALARSAPPVTVIN